MKIPWYTFLNNSKDFSCILSWGCFEYGDAMHLEFYVGLEETFFEYIRDVNRAPYIVYSTFREERLLRICDNLTESENKFVCHHDFLVPCSQLLLLLDFWHLKAGICLTVLILLMAH